MARKKRKYVPKVKGIPISVEIHEKNGMELCETWDDVYCTSSVVEFDDADRPVAIASGGLQFDSSDDYSCSDASLGITIDMEDWVGLPDDTYNDYGCSTLSTSTSPEPRNLTAITRSPAPTSMGMLEPWKEFLLAHFSEAIAPEMVIIDDCFNGWRHMILPLAWSHEIVMDSVLAVSAFHIYGRAVVEPIVNPDRLYARAITQLLARKDLADLDQEMRQLIVLAIVVLLVSVMVNGMSDFPIVFQMLESAINAVGGEELIAKGGDVGSFLLRQIRKMRVYAAPLISQAAGIHAILYHADESFDCLYYYYGLYPGRVSTFDLLVDLRQQAFKIYLHRVLAGKSNVSSSDSERLIESYKETLESFPKESFGEHCLIWPTFIAALECRNPEQQSFFEQFLTRQYQRNRFVNLLRALELLRNVWSQDGAENGVNWPALIPDLRVFIM
ncbi:hypothetical protein CPLU01_13535 [Colletotrichum plurivorum]|uniref:Uncharacterized protein n=1 Tax=Colletotrichum plurivorum TaxID=2175906 RepID=A0A8H6N284_9PEZI|nr:hypothetical protein CPLU01_13535 [Colletotrichum plurivorum]